MKTIDLIDDLLDSENDTDGTVYVHVVTLTEELWLQVAAVSSPPSDRVPWEQDATVIHTVPVADGGVRSRRPPRSRLEREQDRQAGTRPRPARPVPALQQNVQEAPTGPDPRETHFGPYGSSES